MTSSEQPEPNHSDRAAGKLMLPVLGRIGGPNVVEVHYDSSGAATPGRSLTVLGQLSRLAHHPDCGRYDHHLLRPFGVSLCLGCTCASLGAVTALVAGIIIALPQSTEGSLLLYGGALVVGSAPAFVQPYLQKRWFKIPARFALGAGLMGAGIAAWCAPWTYAGLAAKLSICLATLAFFRLALAYRQKRLDNPCAGCPWGGFPLCAHNLEKMRELRAKETDPGAAGLLDALIAQLEPLARDPPRMGVAPDTTARPNGVQFTHAKL